MKKVYTLTTYIINKDNYDIIQKSSIILDNKKLAKKVGDKIIQSNEGIENYGLIIKNEVTENDYYTDENDIPILNKK